MCRILNAEALCCPCSCMAWMASWMAQLYICICCFALVHLHYLHPSTCLLRSANGHTTGRETMKCTLRWRCRHEGHHNDVLHCFAKVSGEVLLGLFLACWTFKHHGVHDVPLPCMNASHDGQEVVQLCAEASSQVWTCKGRESVIVIVILTFE